MVFNNQNSANGAMVLLVDLHHEQTEDQTVEQENAPNLSSNTSIVSLPDPSSGEERHYLRAPRSNENGCDVFEIQSLRGKSTYGSFFVGSRVVSNGALYVSTRVDPLFFALDALAQKSSKSSTSKWQPLDQLTVDFSRVVQDALLCSSGSDNMSQLKHLCETTDKFGDDLILYKFSPERALKWLKKKQERAMQVVKQGMHESKSLELEQKRKKDASGGSGAFSSSFRLADDEKKDSPSKTAALVSPTGSESAAWNKVEEKQALEASLQVVCEYLSKEWRVKLVQSYDLTENALLSEKEKRASQDSSTGEKKRKAAWEAAPGANEADQLLQYTMGVDGSGGSAGQSGDKSGKGKKKQPAQTVGLKKLAKVSTKGMKSLSSFFGKSAKKAKKKSN